MTHHLRGNLRENPKKNKELAEFEKFKNSSEEKILVSTTSNNGRKTFVLVERGMKGEEPYKIGYIDPIGLETKNPREAWQNSFFLKLLFSKLDNVAEDDFIAYKEQPSIKGETLESIKEAFGRDANIIFSRTEIQSSLTDGTGFKKPVGDSNFFAELIKEGITKGGWTLSKSGFLLEDGIVIPNITGSESKFIADQYPDKGKKIEDIFKSNPAITTNQPSASNLLSQIITQNFLTK